jgi:hypothetical protein
VVVPVVGAVAGGGGGARAAVVPAGRDGLFCLFSENPFAES